MKRSDSVKWARAVRKFWDNKCPHCGWENPTCCAAHIVGRMNPRTATVLENGIFACNELHRLMERSEQNKKQIVDRYCPKGTYENLISISCGFDVPEKFGYKRVL